MFEFLLLEMFSNYACDIFHFKQSVYPLYKLAVEDIYVIVVILQ